MPYKDIWKNNYISRAIIAIQSVSIKKCAVATEKSQADKNTASKIDT
jgi:hypothetical protein